MSFCCGRNIIFWVVMRLDRRGSCFTCCYLLLVLRSYCRQYKLPRAYALGRFILLAFCCLSVRKCSPYLPGKTLQVLLHGALGSLGHPVPICCIVLLLFAISVQYLLVSCRCLLLNLVSFGKYTYLFHLSFCLVFTILSWNIFVYLTLDQKCSIMCHGTNMFQVKMEELNMKLFSCFSRRQALYLWRKLKSENISHSMIERLCTDEGLSDLWGWFADFYFESLEP